MVTKKIVGDHIWSHQWLWGGYNAQCITSNCNEASLCLQTWCSILPVATGPVHPAVVTGRQSRHPRERFWWPGEARDRWVDARRILDTVRPGDITTWINNISIVSLGFNVALKSEVISAGSSGTLTNVLPLCLECCATDTGHTIPPRHSIQTQGQPVIVLLIDMERHTGIHNYLF